MMGYRGRDLDLRTREQSGSTRGPGRLAARGQAATRGGGDGFASELAQAATFDGDLRAGGDGLLVDDAVLACCNHAYDLALAHRAAEVALQHLLNAMTRTDAASAVLVANGIDVAGLRHDTASLIAGEEAMITGNERLSPRRSQDLADVLNLAAGRAHNRRDAVSVVDILHALFELNREQPGLVMLKRNAPGWQPRANPEAQRLEPLPPLLGTSYQSDPRFAQPEPRAAEPPREWVRVQPSQPAYYPAPQQTFYVAEGPASGPVTVGVGTMTDVVQNSRLDQMERTIRELSGELAAERKAFSQIVGELRRDVVNHTDSTSRLRGGLDERLSGIEQMVLSARSEGLSMGPQTADRLAGLERNVDAKFGELARGWTILGERLQGLEAAVTTERTETQMPFNLAERLQGLDTLGRALNNIVDRMASLERQVASKPAIGGAAPAVNLQPILERLDGIEQAQQLRPAATSAALAPVIDRLAAIERAQSVRPSSSSVDFQPIIDRLAAMERAANNRQVPTVDLAPVFERLNAIESRVNDTNRGTGAFIERFAQFERKLEAGSGGAERITAQLTERLRAIEDTMVAQRNQVAQLATNLTAEVKGLGQTVAAQNAGAEHIQNVASERMQTLASSFERQRDELASQLAQPMGERIGLVSTLVEACRNELAGQMSAVGERLVTVERQVQTFGQRTLELHDAHGKDLIELHDELVKLNTNQHTLAGTMDQWRLDHSNEFGQLGLRLDGMVLANARPLQMLEGLQASVQTLQRASAKREEQRSRFRNWLMGTDDWYGASWEAQPKDARPPRAGTGTPATGASTPTNANVSAIQRPTDAARPTAVSQPLRPVGAPPQNRG